jgi:hypothetical protein
LICVAAYLCRNFPLAVGLGRSVQAPPTFTRRHAKHATRLVTTALRRHTHGPISVGHQKIPTSYEAWSARDANMATLNDLSLELLILIESHLEQAGLLNISITSRRLREETESELF